MTWADITAPWADCPTEQRPDRQLLFVRHGATAPNEAGLRCGGDLDVPLSELGRTQAQEIAERIALLRPPIGLIVTSSLRRTRETAAIIRHRLGGVPLIIDAGFTERQLGGWNLLTLEETRPWLGGGLTPPGGESNGDFGRRIGKALHRLLPRLAERPLLVSSRGVARMLGELTGRPPRREHANTELDVFDLTRFEAASTTRRDS